MRTPPQLPPVRGISRAYQTELVGLMGDLIDTDDLDSAVALAAYQLKRALAGAAHTDELVPLIAPPLVPDDVEQLVDA
jgi:hypothetical protein